MYYIYLDYYNNLMFYKAFIDACLYINKIGTK